MPSSTDLTSNFDHITIDSVLRDMDHWRTHKNDYPNKAIPDNLWLKIFKLAREHSPSRVKTIFGLNSKQYQVKYDQLTFTDLPPVKTTAPAKSKNASNPTAFCEVSVKPAASTHAKPQAAPAPLAHTSRDALAQLKSNDSNPASYLDISTTIVECIRPDGHRLKIHTTNKKLHEVMKVFFECGVPSL